MPTPDWAGAPYVRIYSTLARDHPRVWRDDQLLAAYVRLLMRAESAWPGPADLPRSITPDVVVALVAEEVIDVEEDLFHFHGLDGERRSRARRGQIGGLVRASSADRDSLGRFAGTSLDDSRTNGTEPPLEESVDVQRAPHPPSEVRSSESSAPTRPPARPQGGRGGESPTRAPASARARERPAPSPNAIYCEAFEAHRQSHQWWEGIGWKCGICEKAAADEDLTFREKVERHTPKDQPF